MQRLDILRWLDTRWLAPPMAVMSELVGIPVAVVLRDLAATTTAADRPITARFMTAATAMATVPAMVIVDAPVMVLLPLSAP